jgi:hypothetical protein
MLTDELVDPGSGRAGVLLRDLEAYQRGRWIDGGGGDRERPLGRPRAPRLTEPSFGCV